MALDLGLTARVQVPITADLAAIVVAAGGDLAYATYNQGWLTVLGVEQAALEAAAAANADPTYSVRVVLNQQAKAELQRRIDAGMPFRGKVLDIDEEVSQRRMTAATVAALLGEISDTDTLTWITADNTPLVLDGESVKIMARMVYRYFTALNEFYWAFRATVQAAPDLDALNALSPVSGWPDPPTDEPLP